MRKVVSGNFLRTLSGRSSGEALYAGEMRNTTLVIGQATWLSPF